MKKGKENQIIDREEIVLESIDNIKTKKTKKRLIRVFSIFIILFLIVLFPLFFYKKENNQNLLSPLYKKGAFHIHSVFSDGTGDLKKITIAAKSNNLDFILMTDHGKPNVKCSESTGWMNEILIIGGSEFSLNCGHLASAGYGFNQKPDYIFPPEPQEAIDDINKTDGISFISHPLDGKIPWTDWDIHGFSGIEILNSYSSAKKTSILNIIRFPLQYLFDKNYALLNTISYPKDNLKLWDDFNKKGNYLGIYALDAHSKLPITKKIVFKWPSYKAMFKIFTIYVKTNKVFERDPDISAKLIIDSMKRGNFFSVIEAISSANGFEIFFIEKNGNRHDLGSSIKNTDGEILLKLPFDFKTDIIIKKDGELFKKIKDNYKKELRIKIKNKGTYRVELFVSDNTFNELPWILTNPFFVGESKLKINKTIDIQIKKPVLIDDSSFNVEKNINSEAKLLITNNEGNNALKLDYFLKKDEKEKDYWVALSRRKKMDFSGYSGITFMTRATEGRRFWFEIRTGNDNNELSYRHSFLSGKEWKKVHIPFKKFHFISGSFIKLDLSKISSIFFAINNSISYNDVRGFLELKEIGLYK